HSSLQSAQLQHRCYPHPSIPDFHPHSPLNTRPTLKPKPRYPSLKYIYLISFSNSSLISYLYNNQPKLKAVLSKIKEWLKNENFILTGDRFSAFQPDCHCNEYETKNCGHQIYKDHSRPVMADPEQAGKCTEQRGADIIEKQIKRGGLGFILPCIPADKPAYYRVT